MADEPLDRPPADPRAIFEVLEQRDVDYLVVGGLAVVAHGHVRVTQDVDILPAPDARNMGRLAAALGDLEAQVFAGGDQWIPLDLSHPETLALGNYFLVTRRGAMDLVNGPTPDLKRYRRLEAAAVTVSLGGHQIKVISKADLIAMKREAGRPKDLSDIAALTEVERSGGSG